MGTEVDDERTLSLGAAVAAGLVAVDDVEVRGIDGRKPANCIRQPSLITQPALV
jgi:hypothetical protein